MRHIYIKIGCGFGGNQFSVGITPLDWRMSWSLSEIGAIFQFGPIIISAISPSKNMIDAAAKELNLK